MSLCVCGLYECFSFLTKPKIFRNYLFLDLASVHIGDVNVPVTLNKGIYPRAALSTIYHNLFVFPTAFIYTFISPPDHQLFLRLFSPTESTDPYLAVSIKTHFVQILSVIGSFLALRDTRHFFYILSVHLSFFIYLMIAMAILIKNQVLHIVICTLAEEKSICLLQGQKKK